MVAYYVVAYVLAFGVACAFCFFLLRHWIRAIRGRNGPGGHRKLRAAERAYEKQVEASKRRSPS